MNRNEPEPANVDLENLPELQRRLLEWYRRNARDLPWRRTRDPYRILVSEVMLQQTQVSRVEPRYHSFISRFPDVHALANAPTAEVISEWSGLGYNRRAINLQRTARAVVDEHGGEFPADVSALQRLPGIGPYTAGAITCFAFEQDVGFLDTNIRRLLHRLYFGPEVPQPVRSPKAMQALAESIVPTGRGWEWGQALIEFGALQCTARKPACLTCPLQNNCAAFPEIQSVLAELTRTGFRRKKEASFAGSNRDYRGRVMRALQLPEAGEQGLDLHSLGRRVREDYGDEHHGWLRGVVDGLSRDGLVEIAEDIQSYDRDGTLRIRLPGTPPPGDASGEL
jgi:A/G-specific adenine glycosylase